MNELDIAKKAAKEAGNLAKEAFHSKKDIQQKGAFDLITDTDIKCEELIKKIIMEAFPDDEILAEESGTSGKSDRLWVIDPIDGTVNFAYGLPNFGISIAFIKNDKPQAGAIYFPIYDELYVAEKGKGAFLNGKPIHVSSRDSLAEAMLIHDSSFSKKSSETQMLPNFMKLAPASMMVRMTGCATRSAVHIASGQCDTWVIYSAKPWDIAAGGLILEEAGGKLTDHKGNPWTFRHGSIAGSNGKVHDLLLELLKEQ